MLEVATSSYGPRGDEVIQQQRVEGPESTPCTLNSLIDHFSQRIDPVGIVVHYAVVVVVVVRVCASSPINPSRLSNQFCTSADRCTPTLPRWSLE